MPNGDVAAGDIRDERLVFQHGSKLRRRRAWVAGKFFQRSRKLPRLCVPVAGKFLIGCWYQPKPRQPMRRRPGRPQGLPERDCRNVLPADRRHLKLFAGRGANVDDRQVVCAGQKPGQNDRTPKCLDHLEDLRQEVADDPQDLFIGLGGRQQGGGLKFACENLCSQGVCRPRMLLDVASEIRQNLTVGAFASPQEPTTPRKLYALVVEPAKELVLTFAQEPSGVRQHKVGEQDVIDNEQWTPPCMGTDMLRM
jgi:hypothetical protein